VDLSQDWSGKLVGEYRLLRRLGSGSFGEVYYAEDIRERSPVAVKLVKSPLTQREDLKAFLNEARSMRLRHPHIVPLLDFGLSEQDLPFLVMEYVAGGTLRDRYPKGSRVPLEMVIDLTIQLASALQYAHDRHLIHRDVKPENMLCRTDDTVLLSDFGIASVAHASSSVSAYQSFGGTLPYMAPEQLEGHPRPASDQYALAVVVYEWLAGARPFAGTVPELVSQHLHASPPSLLKQIPTLPAEVEQVAFKALAKQPQERFACVEDFAVALQVAGGQRPVPGSRISSPPPLTPPLEERQPVQDQVIIPDEARGNISLSTASSSASELKARAEQSVFTELPPNTLSSAGMMASEDSSGSNTLLIGVAGSHPVQPRKIFNRRMFFTCGLALLVILSGSSLWYFTSTGQRAVRLSPAQAVAATATAAAHAYATGTARQGVMFGFDAAHTGYNPYEHTLSPGNVSHLVPLWSFITEDEIFSSPVVAGGIVYVGSDQLYAFDASCRKACLPLWSFGTEKLARYSTPAVAGGMVYVSSDKLYAFDSRCRQACQPLWSFPIGTSAPTVAGSMVYASSNDGKFYAFDASCRHTCQPLWSFPIGTFTGSSPAVADGMIYVSSDGGKLYAFDATCRNACQPLWSFLPKIPASSKDSSEVSPTVAGGIVYFGSTESKLYAFDANCRKTCQPLWSFAAGSFASSPAVAGGIAYVGSFDDKFYAFDASCRHTCQPLWRFATDNVIIASPTVAGGVVYLGYYGGKLYAFDASCRHVCQPLWSFQLEASINGDSIVAPPTVADGMVYVNSLDHKIYAFGLSS
jgi:serine/threonine protein kinase/outer membrane protein assembly factor BamB